MANVTNMATVTESNHIRVDETGVAWVLGTNTKVSEIVIDKLTHGSSPEEIHFQYPYLSLGQIHSALAFYYDHKDEVEKEIETRIEAVERLRESIQNKALQERLREQLAKQ